MINTLHEFSLKVTTAVANENSPNFRPTEWPPNADWPVVIDKNGLVISRWSDSRWNLSPWAKTACSLNFSEAEESLGGNVDDTNGELLKLAIGYLIWGPDGLRATSTITTKFSYLRRIFAFCSMHKISAANLMRYPKILDELPSKISPSSWQPIINIFSKLNDAREILGFTILDNDGLRRLARASIEYRPTQTPYIPQRIWTYQTIRLKECIDDFLLHKEKIDKCFSFCRDAYINNYGSLESSLEKGKDETRGPFTAKSRLRRGCNYFGKFTETSEKFGIKKLIEKWLGNGGSKERVSTFSTYFSLVTFASLAYIATITLQRKEEVAAIRSSCLSWENDEKFGRIAIICGPTTKTDNDSDARWAASPTVADAVNALQIISRLRMQFDAENSRISPTEQDKSDPLLNSTSTEPWSSGTGACNPYHIRVPLDSISAYIQRYPLLFDENELRIKHEDLKIARQITPNLCEKTFAIGKPWPLAWHQYRRTGAVNMFSSGIISDSSMQQQMKHITRLMSLYYGKEHTRLSLNEELQETIISTMYEIMAQKLQEVVTERFISPNSQERKDELIVNILSAKDTKNLSTWVKAGKVNYRENRLGGCMKSGYCEYGGIESIARCTGGDGGKPCNDVLYDKEKRSQIQKQLVSIKAEMQKISENHPRYKALDAEKKGMENYLNVITAA